MFYRSGTRGVSIEGIWHTSSCYSIFLHWARSTIQVCPICILFFLLYLDFLLIKFQFRYIALELCVASLQDYIENRYNGTAIDGITILRHATAGIAHLHSLDIVHRDVKVHSDYHIQCRSSNNDSSIFFSLKMFWFLHPMRKVKSEPWYLILAFVKS